MKIDTTEKWLPIYEALASKVRLKIIQLLSKQPMNIKELANELSLSSAILTMHIRKLEEAQIIKSERVHINGAIHKVSNLILDSLEIDFPTKQELLKRFHELTLPIGHYTDFNITPTCGLATQDTVIGFFDDPRYFLAPERVNASILWFTQGFVEYKLPNHLLSDQTPIALEISLELCSEAPGVNNHWPSDITFFLNGIKLGLWTSPGDFGGSRGRYTPEWWSLDLGQYGFLKIIKIDENGTFMDGQKISDITLNQINIRQQQWTFRVSVLEESEHAGGVTIFGAGFGNYNQDIILRLYYK